MKKIRVIIPKHVENTKIINIVFTYWTEDFTFCIVCKNQET